MNVVTSNDVPPPYQEKEIVEAIDMLRKNPPTQAQIEKAQAVIIEMANEPTFREKVMQEVKDLRKTVLQIETDFSTIATAIQGIDNKEAIRDKTTNAPIKVLPEWKEIQATYTDLRSASQTTATEVKVKVEYLFKDLIPMLTDMNTTLDDKKAELGGFTDELDKFAIKAGDKAKGFLDLRQRVLNYRTNLVQLVGDQQEEVKQKIKDIINQIRDLEKTLAESEGFFSAAWSALKFAVPASGATVAAVSGVGHIAAVAGLTALAPVASVGLLVGGLGALGFGIFKGLSNRAQDRAGKESQISELMRKKNELEVRAEDLRNISTQVGLLETTFLRIADRLSVLEQIWTMLKSDAVDLRTSVEGMHAVKTPGMFKTRVNHIAQLWMIIARVLDDYALGVSPITTK